MNKEEFINLKNKFNIYTADVVRATGLSKSHLSEFEKGTKGLSNESVTKIEDFFDALAVADKKADYFLAFFDVSLHQIAVVDVDRVQPDLFRVRVFDLQSKVWTNSNMPTLVYYAEKIPSLTVIKKKI